jgi:hypothetical protein
MAFRSCTDCLNADQASSMVSVTCRDGSEVEVGLGSEAFGFMIIDQGLGDNAFCRACAERVQSRNCPTSQSGRPNVEVEPIGGSGMRSASGHSSRVGSSGCPTGKSLYWLSERYPEIKIHTIDFNKNCENIFEPLRELIPQIVDISIQDASQLDYAPDSFDSITALDFYEHTPEPVMIESLKMNRELLRDGGKMFLYVGKTPNEEHINLIPDAQTIDLCRGLGFTFETEINELLVFRK